MKKSNMNLHILFDMLGAKTTDEKTTIVEEYYRFSILKKGKYLGVNMKTIRETMIHTFYPEIKDKQHDSYRSKLYAITDYLLFRSLHKSSDLENMVAVLRETSDEGEKDILYRDFAKTAWEKLKDLLVPFFKNFKTNLQEKYVQYRVNKDSKTDSCNEPKVDTTLIDGVKMSTSKAVPFVQLLAFLCHFLEGKEINELLSAYIHKFENIQSFINTLKELGETVNFSKNYALFDDSGGKRAGEIAKQLRVLVSIGKMKPDLDDAKRVLYKAAIETLGVPDDSQYVSDEWLAENVLLDKTAPNYKNRKTDINPFRNFIAGNVISSRRFMYLVRYTKPKTVRALMSNRTIVHYVLSRIADIQDAHITESQLDRYYQNLPQYDEMRPNVPKEQKINALADYLVHYSFEKNVFLQKKGIVLNTKSPQKNVEIERLKALTGLYLTVAFIAIKNLVKANARYYIAFAAFERDHEMMKRKSGEAVTKHHIKYGEGKNDFCDAFSLTEYFLDCEDANDYHPAPGQPFNKEACRKHLDSIQRHFSKKWREIFRQNITEAKKVNATGFLLTEVRNHAAHLNVVTSLPKYVGDFRKKTHGQGMQSYFELYHYLMQRLLCEEKGLEISQEQKMFIDYGK